MAFGIFLLHAWSLKRGQLPSQPKQPLASKKTALLALLALLLAGTAPLATALQITRLSPQGEVATIRQIMARFDESAVAFGDPKAAAPLAVSCTEAAAAKGTGRWLSDKEWVFDFAADLPPGVRCTVKALPGFKSAQGAAITGTVAWQFNSGGPFVKAIYPDADSGAIDEEQFFILQLSGAATLESVQKNVYCAIDGLKEKVAVRLVAGKERDTLLNAQGNINAKEAALAPLATVTLACNRRFTPASQVEIVYGKGVATPSGIVNSVEKRFGYTVREPFAANFTCERENAQSACLPLRPMVLYFNAPVARKLAEGVVLKGLAGGASFKPDFESGEEGSSEGEISQLVFKPMFPEQAQFQIELPKNFTDTTNRPLRNADSFPLKVATGAMPPLAKFAASPFGIVERFAEPGLGGRPSGVALLPVTVRNVEAALRVQGLTAGSPAGGAASTGKVSNLQLASDADIIAWYQRVQRYGSSEVSRANAQKDSKIALPKVLPPTVDKEGNKIESNTETVETRMVSLLGGQPNVKTLDLPAPAGAADPRPFEVIGIPLTPGFHVVEIASPRLGASLLDTRHGSGRTMYVRTSALVTNLGVHFKQGRGTALVWVTTLDKGQPLDGSVVRVSDCNGREVAKGTTGRDGIARFAPFNPPVAGCDNNNDNAYFVSARKTGTDGIEDMAFTWSNWQKGIEPWRFNVPTGRNGESDDIAHTIFDRTLLRAGETVSMKHLLRSQTGIVATPSAGKESNFSIPKNQPPMLRITHIGSGQEYRQSLVWRKTASGGLSAESTFAIPPAAKLGMYSVRLGPDPDTKTPPRTDNGGYQGPQDFASGRFRVEEFRLPVLEGRIGPLDGKKAIVSALSVTADVQINYVAGGGASNLPVRVSALVRGKALNFSDYEAYSFQPPQRTEGSNNTDNPNPDSRVVADKLALMLDKNGAGKVVMDKIPASRFPQDLQMEATFSDPNGEVQTIRGTTTLWPAGVIAGIKTDGWVSLSGKNSKPVNFQALALDLSGKPAPGTQLEVKAVAHITTTSRKRMVGGFYTYDNKTETKDLGQVCKGKADARGLLLCETGLSEAGEIELIATATDSAGNTMQAASTVYVTQQGELWFGSEDHDRMDILPEKKSYQPGETAVFQVRMPFRFATALVAVEREGIVQTEVVQLNGRDPTVRVKVGENWGPNVYVSVLALRGRLREVPWYSFFTWGYQAPREWWTAFWIEGREYIAPTAMVDLSKPAFRLGMAEIRVGAAAHQLAVSVKADKPSYAVRGSAIVSISARLPNGQPAANAEVALAAVDEALLELMPNSSWGLLEAMLQRRPWGVETSTMQMEIIGRRHYGRKAVPAGGGGGRGQSRELLETLLLWNPKVQLDAKGEAQVTVPLNDALTTFRIVAVADAGAGMFGTGETKIRATQDLQIISGLPPLVREGDSYRAQFTLRNTTGVAMNVTASPRATLLPELPPQTVQIPPNEAREVAWDVVAPAGLGLNRLETLLWDIEAKDSTTGSVAKDALKARQRIVPAVPLTVQQATLVQVDGTFNLDVQAPADAFPGRGGLKLAFQPKLAEGQDAVRDWFANYPFACLEQKTSKSIGLRDAKMWQSVAAQLPGYLDSDGLAAYFPAGKGSDTLTAYVLAATHEAGQLDERFALSDAVRAPMERGLTAFIEGRIQREFWSPRKDLEMRKLSAIEALSRYGKANARMLESITIAPNQWPTHAVIDWLKILQRMDSLPQRDKRLAEAQQILQSRISYQGTRAVFSTEQDDYWWWLMVNGDVNAARLLLAVMDEPAWKADMPRLVNGFIARQNKGAWHTTNANFWGGLALERFSKAFESVPVAGMTRAALTGVAAAPASVSSASAAATATAAATALAAARAASIDWSRVQRIEPGLPLPVGKTLGGVEASVQTGAPVQTTAFGAPASPGNLRGNTAFLPWSTNPGKDTLSITHTGTGKPWLTLQSIAAVDLKAPFNAGYAIKKTITPVEQAVAGKYTKGDILRIKLEVTSTADMTWVAVTDPIPGGATILGGGLGRDSQIATQGERKTGWAAFEERSFESFRSYYDYLPKGSFTMEYTVRLNNPGSFSLPPSRVEAMYAPEMFGESPNARMVVVNNR